MVDRWIERVQPDASREQARVTLLQFLDRGALEDRPRGWLRSKNGFTARDGQAPLAWAFSAEWPGVALVVAMTNPLLVLTVLTRRVLKDGERQRASYRRSVGKRAPLYKRRINEAS